MERARELVLKRQACVWNNNTIRVVNTLPTTVEIKEAGIIAYIGGFARKMYVGETLTMRPNIVVEFQNVTCRDIGLEFNAVMSLIN